MAAYVLLRYGNTYAVIFCAMDIQFAIEIIKHPVTMRSVRWNSCWMFLIKNLVKFIVKIN